MSARRTQFCIAGGVTTVTLLFAAGCLALGIAAVINASGPLPAGQMDRAPGAGYAAGAAMVAVVLGVGALFMSVMMIGSIIRSRRGVVLTRETGTAFGVAAVLSLPVLLAELFIAFQLPCWAGEGDLPSKAFAGLLALVTFSYLSGCLVARRAFRRWASGPPESRAG